MKPFNFSNPIQLSNSEIQQLQTKRDYPAKSVKGKVIVVKKQKILVGQEANQRNQENAKWTLIGGTCEPTETVIEATAREFVEETIGSISVEDITKTLKKCNRIFKSVYPVESLKQKIVTYIFIVNDTDLNLHIERFHPALQILKTAFTNQPGRLNPEIREEIKKSLGHIVGTEKVSKNRLKPYMEMNAIEYLKIHDATSKMHFSLALLVNQMMDSLKPPEIKRSRTTPNSRVTPKPRQPKRSKSVNSEGGSKWTIVGRK